VNSERGDEIGHIPVLSPLEVAPPYGGSGPTPKTWLLGPSPVSPQTTSLSVQPFLYSSPV